MCCKVESFSYSECTTAKLVQDCTFDYRNNTIPRANVADFEDLSLGSIYVYGRYAASIVTCGHGPVARLIVGGLARYLYSTESFHSNQEYV